MPLVTVGDQLVLRCINEPHRPVLTHEGGPFFFDAQAPSQEDAPTPPYDASKRVSLPEGQTTMQELPGWGFVPGTSTPRAMGGAKVTLENGVPVRTYRCHVCGYMEFYSGVVVAADVWGRNAKP